MYICGAKFQEHCFNISRDIVYSVFYHFQLQTIWRHHWSNLHNRKTSISLKLREIFQKEKRHSSVFWKAFQISRKNFSCHMHFKLPRLQATIFKEARNSFHFPRLVLQILFQLQFGLSYQYEIYHRNKWNVINHYIIFFLENLLLWQRYNAFSCTPKIESYRVIKRTGRWNLLKLLHYMLLGMIVEICNLWKNSVGQKKVEIFDYCFSNFFSHLQNFLKIGIYTHPIDLSCHQKFEKNSPAGSENISARSWKIWKSHGRLDLTL